MTLLAPFRTTRTTSASTLQRGIGKTANGLLIGGFFLVMGVPFWGIFRSDVSQEIEQAEGRRAAAFPEMQFKGHGVIRRPETRSLREFPRAFEKWFNDRIGFRQRLIQIYQVARHYGWTPSGLSQAPAKSQGAALGVCGHVTPATANAAGQPRVLEGREGWLFYGSDSMIADYRGTSLFSNRELARWKEVLSQRRDWLARRGIRYVFVLVPNKNNIYPEMMPRSINRVSEESRLSQLADYLARESDLTVVNLLEPLRQAKTTRRVFHKTDTHWNAYGAFIGYQEMMKPIQAWFPQVSVPTIEDYEVVVHSCDRFNVENVSPWVIMDLARMLGSPIPHEEKVIDLVPQRAELQGPIVFRGSPKNEAERTKHHTGKQGELENVFVLHDSCMMALAPFVTPHCREVTYKWRDDFPAEEIEQARPVLVIQQMVQRRLMSHEPKNPAVVIEELQEEK